MEYVLRNNKCILCDSFAYAIAPLPTRAFHLLCTQILDQTNTRCEVNWEKIIALELALIIEIVLSALSLRDHDSPRTARACPDFFTSILSQVNN